MSDDNRKYYPPRKRYIPRELETDRRRSYYDEPDYERGSRREERPRPAGERPRYRDAYYDGGGAAPRLSKSGRAARVVFIVSLSLLILICGSYAFIYAYANQRFFSKITFEDQTQTVVQQNLDDVVIEDDGDTGEQGEVMSEEDAAALESMIDGGLVSDENLYGEKGVTNVLLLGSDSRDQNSIGSRSDAMILLSINENTKQLVMTSIMRDTCVSIPGRTALDKINAANAYGGAQLAVKTVECNFGVKIDRYIVINFFAFIDIVNALDGLTVDINEDERRVMNDYITEINQTLGLSANDGKLQQAGTGLLLTGKQVLGYVRNRYTGNGDFQRTERQRIVLDKIIEKCKSSSITTLLDVVEAAASHMSTNYTKDELMSLAYSALDYIDYSVVQSRLPIDDTWNYASLNGMSIIQMDTSANRREMIKVIYGK